MQVEERSANGTTLSDWRGRDEVVSDMTGMFQFKYLKAVTYFHNTV